jgi:AhpD family alkylhydroperoxidase
MTHVTPAAGVTKEAAPIAGDIATRVARGGHQPLISNRRRGSTRFLIRHARELKAIWINERIDPGFREQLMLAVAGANSCRQCSYAHREWALAEGVSEAELAALEGLDEESFDAREWAAIAWVQAKARSDFEAVPEIIDANFRQHFTEQEQADIELVVRVMYWLNETSNAVDALWSRIKGKPVPGSGVLREIGATVLYIIVVPILFIFIGAKQRRRPMEIIRGMRPFFSRFEVHE